MSAMKKEAKGLDHQIYHVDSPTNDSPADANYVLETNIEANLQRAAKETLQAPDKTWAVFTRNPRMLCVMGAVLLNGIICGIELNMSGNMLGLPAFCRQMGGYDAATQSYIVSPGHVSAWTGFGWPGQIAGMISSGLLADRFGRRFVMWLIVSVTILGAILEVTAKNWIAWGIAKLFMGLATGLMQAGVSTYIGEVAPREIRGIALGTFNMLMNLGNLLATIIAWASQKRWPDPLDNKQFKVPLYVMCGLPILIIIAELCFLVESPSWLLMQNEVKKAKKSLRFMYPYLTEEDLTLELAKMQYTLEKEAEQHAINESTSFFECFKGIDLRRSFCAIFPAMTQPLAGNILYGPFATYFFSLAGQSNALQSAAIVQATGFAANVAIFFLIENPRLGGRWRILFGGLSLETLGMIVIGTVGSIWRDPSTSAVAGNLLVAFTVIGNIGSVTGPGAAGWAYTAESGSARLRAKTTTLGNLGNCMMMNASGVYAPYLLSTTAYAKWGEQTGFFFGALGLVSLIVVYFFIPDYTGRNYAQIDELFIRGIAARKFQATECTGDYGRDVLREHSAV